MVERTLIEHGTMSANGIEFGFLASGTRGPLALCLHGFPDTAHTWRHLLPRLAEAGFRAVAPFMRGYAPTAVDPGGVYQVGALAADANALHDAFGAQSDAVVIGHDWGASATYGAVGSEPERWRRVVGLAVPPGAVVANALLTNLDQLQRGWYMFLLLHPIADLIARANDYAFIERLWAQWSPGYDSATDVDQVREALAEPEHLLAAIGYYRALLGTGPRDHRYAAGQHASGVVPPQPTLYLHGRNDGCLGIELATSADAIYPDHVVTEIVEDAGHFLHLEQPDEVNRLIIEFVSA